VLVLSQAFSAVAEIEERPLKDGSGSKKGAYQLQQEPEKQE
jgi:hypothetical protein